MISIHDQTVLCQHYLNLVYQNTASFCVNHKATTVTDTYGEVLFDGVNKILSQLKLTADDVFLDLGSGLGKVVLQVFLQSDVKKACGIELSPVLHEQAQFAVQRVKDEIPDIFNNRSLEFLQGNFLEIALNDATVALLASPCYSQSLLDAMGTKLDDSSIHTVVSLRPLNNLRRFRFIKAIKVEGSWDSALCYLYKSRLR